MPAKYTPTTIALAVKVAFLAAIAAGQAEATPVVPLSGLNGINGFKINGEPLLAQMGRSVSAAGDVNGDGIDDVIVGAESVGSGPAFSIGRSYVVFGRTDGFPASFELSGLDGNNGFMINGEAESDLSGGSVRAAGDVNGDGIDDLIVGARGADPGGMSAAGRSYVIFGRKTFGASVLLADINGTDGFKIDGETEYDQSGFAVSAAGDINNDGVDDLIVGAFTADVGMLSYAGRSYVIFGHTGNFESPLALSALDGSSGFKIDGEAARDLFGTSVSAAGDVNGDGIDDLIIGAKDAGTGAFDRAGQSYVVFGRGGPFPSPLALSSLDGTNGFRIDGEGQFNYSGGSVSGGGDVNGDGFDDLIVGAKGALLEIGRTYVIFGHGDGFVSPLALANLDGTDGFKIDGEAQPDNFGWSVSNAGDVNADGIDDLIVGSPNATPGAPLYAGRSYVVFGRREGFDSPMSLASLNGEIGFAMDGEGQRNYSGTSVSGAGDVNGDGIDDLITGAPLADVGTRPNDGRSYVVFGARDRVFRDGNEIENIEEFYPRLRARRGAVGSSVRWSNGATCNCSGVSFDFNLFSSASGDLAFSWSVPGPGAGVANGGSYSVLQPGSVIGPGSNFSTDSTAAATADWRAGVSGFLGFRFLDPDTGQVNYGYAELRTSAPNGYPAWIERFSINLTGQSVTIPDK